MYRDRSSLQLLALIAALPLFLFVSFTFAFQAQNRQRAVERNAMADSQLLMARADGLLGRALATTQALATAGPITNGDATDAPVRAAVSSANEALDVIHMKHPNDQSTIQNPSNETTRRFDLLSRVRQSRLRNLRSVQPHGVPACGVCVWRSKTAAGLPRPFTNNTTNRNWPSGGEACRVRRIRQSRYRRDRLNKPGSLDHDGS